MLGTVREQVVPCSKDCEPYNKIEQMVQMDFGHKQPIRTVKMMHSSGLHQEVYYSLNYSGVFLGVMWI